MEEFDGSDLCLSDQNLCAGSNIVESARAINSFVSLFASLKFHSIFHALSIADFRNTFCVVIAVTSGGKSTYSIIF